MIYHGPSLVPSPRIGHPRNLQHRGQAHSRWYITPDCTRDRDTQVRRNPESSHLGWGGRFPGPVGTDGWWGEDPRTKGVPPPVRHRQGCSRRRGPGRPVPRGSGRRGTDGRLHDRRLFPTRGARGKPRASGGSRGVPAPVRFLDVAAERVRRETLRFRRARGEGVAGSPSAALARGPCGAGAVRDWCGRGPVRLWGRVQRVEQKSEGRGGARPPGRGARNGEDELRPGRNEGPGAGCGLRGGAREVEQKSEGRGGCGAGAGREEWTGERQPGRGARSEIGARKSGRGADFGAGCGKWSRGATAGAGHNSGAGRESGAGARGRGGGVKACGGRPREPGPEAARPSPRPSPPLAPATAAVSAGLSRASAQVRLARPPSTADPGTPRGRRTGRRRRPGGSASAALPPAGPGAGAAQGGRRDGDSRTRAWRGAARPSARAPGRWWRAPTHPGPRPRPIRRHPARPPWAFAAPRAHRLRAPWLPHPRAPRPRPHRDPSP